LLLWLQHFNLNGTLLLWLQRFNLNGTLLLLLQRFNLNADHRAVFFLLFEKNISLMGQHCPIFMG
jgi:hypothetical protein